MSRGTDLASPADPEELIACVDGPEPAPADPLTLAVYRLMNLFFLGTGLWVCWTAIGMAYYSPIGPGPGFFPFWAGALLAAPALGVLIHSFRPDGVRLAERLLPLPRPLLRIAVVIGAVAGFALFTDRLGFALTMFGMLLVMLLANGCRFVPTALTGALIGSFGVAYAFQNWLGVYLPPAPGGLLRFIGM